ncbi:FAD/NAD(P)-binding protein [Nocardia sp. NPDC057455]|uniref:FAD/NAD(P)-binding protein n=1 Tax=Nocardia sp. NPDC057455 TaxID=3346138 RepID=UPI00366D86A2
MHIGIIGAGAAAVALLDALAAADRAPGSITVFDGSPAVWRGRPYQPDLEAVRVNAPPALMSARADDRAHYERWLRDRGNGAGHLDEGPGAPVAGAEPSGGRPERTGRTAASRFGRDEDTGRDIGDGPVEASSARAVERMRRGDDVEQYIDEDLGVPLVPRGVYGAYLEQTAHAAISRLRARGRRVSVVNARVTGFTRESSAVLHTDDGGSHRVDRAVLCVGSGRPRDHYGLAGTPGYVNEPYPLATTTTDIASGAHVAVIGSGLTAVDIAAALTANGHTGPITFLSRSGVLPYVQQRPLPLAPRYLTPPRALELAEQGPLPVTRLVELMRAELADSGQDFESFATEILETETEDPPTRLRRQLDAVDSPHHGRRLLTMAIRTLGPILWPVLAEQDRTMLRERYFRTISSLSSPMVPHNARIILRLLDSGQLRLRPGVTKLTARPGGGFTVFDGTAWPADMVFNAVNPPAYTTPQEAEPLLGALIATGAAELAPTGGLRTEPGTRRLLVGDHPDPTWHALGNLAADSMFIATNPPGLAAEASILAGHLTIPR